ncbi:hypothetical protein [Prosthecobacter sp.]|uniref:hypothetical protein n=1 Tax=Prosthecobacter sp. TaxID=1965333 RepID=UPI001DEC2E13|nr:hypothetical protein [Prosthecobacter sp.]MCB1278519.1 hypothetical protein [Prosthecobacter sp.]
MNLLPLSFDVTGLLDLSPYLTKGSDTGNGVTLMIGDMYSWGLLGGGPLLILAALMLVKIMYARVKFFALEYGNGGFFGRVRAIAPFITLGTALFLVGVAALWIGWQVLGYSVTVNAKGVTETTQEQTIHYEWADATGASKRVKSTEFWVTFAKDGRKCRVDFQQRFIGEKVQDKAIEIVENALLYSKVPRLE